MAKIKAKARSPIPQTREETATAIRQIGDLQREHTRSLAAMNDAIAEIANVVQPKLDGLAMQIAELQEGVQGYCEAHRDELTNDVKVKTAQFVTGEIQWRQRPPSVNVRGADSVIETLIRLGLSKFVREKREVNKDAILNEPEQVQGVAGIKIVTGVEDFVISPFEAEA